MINMDTGPSEMRPRIFYSKLIEDFYSEFAIKNFE